VGQISKRRKISRAAAAALALLVALPAAWAPAQAQRPVRQGDLYDLRKAPKPRVTGKEIIEGLEEFVERFPMRQNGMPDNIAASEFLAKEAEKYGFRSRIIEYEVSGRTVRVVQSIKRGRKRPRQWIAFIAHYDTVPTTLQGAYDDGSGTNMMRFFAKAFSRVRTNRSIVMMWFDAEENGLLASRAHAEALRKRGQRIVAGLGFDMVGIGYPARYCICIYHGSRPRDPLIAEPIIDHVNFKFLRFPEGDGGAGVTQRWPLGTDPHVCNCGPNIRNSDEQSFAAQGYFTLRWAGMRTALDYPGYHLPWDTVAMMELVAGGRELLEEGTENTFKSAWYTTFVLDNL
jgi:hypothetical protein